MNLKAVSKHAQLLTFWIILVFTRSAYCHRPRVSMCIAYVTLSPILERAYRYLPNEIEILKIHHLWNRARGIEWRTNFSDRMNRYSSLHVEREKLVAIKITAYCLPGVMLPRGGILVHLLIRVLIVEAEYGYKILISYCSQKI